MKRTKKWTPQTSPSRTFTATSARRGAAERRRQEELRSQYGNWFLAHRAARLERQAAEAGTTGADGGPGDAE